MNLHRLYPVFLLIGLGTATPVQAQLTTGVNQNVTAVDEELKKVEKRQIYLKRLDHLQEAVKKELSIAQLLRECDKFDAVCTGEGLSLKEPEPPLPVPQAPPLPEPSSEPPPEDVPEPEISELPVFLSVHQGVAIAEYEGRRVEVRPGDRLGSYTVTAVDLHYVELTSAQGRERVSLQWRDIEAMRQ